jgi:hypothetical protein
MRPQRFSDKIATAPFQHDCSPVRVISTLKVADFLPSNCEGGPGPLGELIGRLTDGALASASLA